MSESLENMLAGLNDNQREGVLHISSPLLLLAGAGSGKTLVITKKIAYLIKECGVSPENILAVTFTNKAAAEMKERVSNFLPEIRAYRFNIRTFHSTGLNILRGDAKYLGYRDNFLVIDEDDKKSIIKTIIKNNNLKVPKDITVKSIIRIISLAKNSISSHPSEYIKELRLDSDIYENVYEKYREYLMYENVMDFDDLLINVIKLFEKEISVLNYYRNKWKYILVDEFQDTNALQYKFIKMLTKNNDNQLTIVGDDDQSIYAFRGAMVSNILNFKDDYKNTHIIKLEENYRCPKDVVEVALNIIKNNKDRHEKNVFSNKANEYRVEEWECGSDIDEATSTVSEIEELFNNGFNARDIVILFRVNSQSRLYEDKLRSHHIDYKIIGGVGFYERMEIKDTLAYLRLLCGINDNLSLRRIINTPPRTIGEKSISILDDIAYSKNISLYDAINKSLEDSSMTKKARENMISFKDKIEDYKALISEDIEEHNGDNIESLFFKFLSDINYFSIFDSKEDHFRTITASENIKELFRAYYEYRIVEPNSSINNFLRDASLVRDSYTESDSEEKKDYITLMTVHNAKGLEFDVVFLSGLENGTFPHFFAIESGEEGIEEERRLCYVAITRAKRKLYLTYSKKRRMSMGIDFKIPSMFLKEIPQELLKKRMINIISNNYMEIDDDAFDY